MREYAFISSSGTVVTTGNLEDVTGTGVLSSGSIASGFGNIETGGNIETTGSGTVTAAGTMSAAGGLTVGSKAVLETTTVAAGATISVDSATSSHVSITDDSSSEANALSISTTGAEAGQLLFIHNGDAQATSGAVSIASGDSVLMVFDGTQWEENSITEMSSGTISGVTMSGSDVTVGSGKTLDVSSGTLTLANDQISGDKISGGQIGGSLVLGDSSTDTLQIQSTIEGSLVLEGTADDAHETTVSVTGPTADRTISLPDARFEY